MENCFVTIAVWVGIKILFLLGSLSVAYFGSSHPERRNKPFPKLDLKFLDKDYYRFGLASLDKLYRGAIWLVLIALVAFYLQQISNVSKGPLIVAGPEHGVSYPQVATLIAPTFVMLAILIVPAAVYVRLLRRAREREITRLAQEVADQRNRLRAAATDQEKEVAQDELAELGDKIPTVEKQTPWPKGDWEFFAVLIVAAIILFVGVFGTGGAAQPKNVAADWIIKVSLALPALIDRICK
jgi:hypothetical protein